MRGICKYVPNAMYTVVLLAIYHPGLPVKSRLGSRLGVIAAPVNYLFVWTHYLCTERPDMREICGRKESAKF